MAIARGNKLKVKLKPTQYILTVWIRYHFVKYHNFTLFPGVKSLRKGNCAFPQYFPHQEIR